MNSRKEELIERIEKAYDETISLHSRIDLATTSIEESQTRVKLENQEEYMAAKNGDQRAVLMSGWLQSDEDHVAASGDLSKAESELKIVRFEIEKLKLLVELQKGEA